MQLSSHRNKERDEAGHSRRAAIVTGEMEGVVDMMPTTRTKEVQKGSRDIELTRMLEGRRSQCGAGIVKKLVRRPSGMSA